MAQVRANIGVWEYDPAANTIWLSEETSRMFGLARTPDGKTPVGDIRACVPEWETVRQAYRDLVEKGCEFTIESPANPADGSAPRTLKAIAQVIRNGEGKPVKVMGFIQDISRMKAKDAAFQATVRNIVASIGIESLDRITEGVASWLEADCVMIGEIMPDKKKVRVLSMILDGKHVRNFYYILKGSPCENVTGKGYCIYPKNAVAMFPTAKDMVDLNIQGYVGTAMRNAEGQVMGILCILTRRPLEAPPALREIIDLIAVKATAEIERRQVEELIRKGERLLAEAMDLARLASWEFDIETGTFAVDDRFYSLYGTSSEREGAGRISLETYVREFVYPDDHDTVTNAFAKATGATDPEYGDLCGHRIVGRDGEIRHIVMRIGITNVPNTRTIKIHGANQDITELKLAEQALLQANHKINLLSTITRHDILNQIQAIRSCLELARMQVSNADMSKMINTLEKVTLKIQSQIEFTRVYQDLGTHEPRWQSINGILQRISVPHSITLQSDPEDIEVYADPIFEKVFSSLMDNSLRHGKRVSAVRVSTRADTENLTIVWEDDGVGIPREEKSKIFEKGYGKNTGLGLFLTCGILAITGITIRENGEPGKGARFEMRVPKRMCRCPGSGRLPHSVAGD
ncbi:MAG: ATP-binding protein [Methanoregulaceae archaeon]